MFGEKVLALRRVRAEGVKRRLVGIEIEGAPIEFNMTRWPVHFVDPGKMIPKA